MDLKLDWLSFTFHPVHDATRSDVVGGDYSGIKNEAEKNMWRNIDKSFADDLNNTSDIVQFFDMFPEFKPLMSDFCILGGYSHYENILGFMGISDTCRIAYNTEGYSSVEMGVNVSIPSHGLEWFFNLMGFDVNDENAVSALFQELKNRDCTCSRIDLAFDDYSKRFRPKQYIAWFYSENLRTKFRKITTAGSLREVGHTFYLGDRKKKMLRVYDKDVESHGAIDAVRYEFELHQHHAKDMFEYLIEHKTIDFISFIKTYFEVIDLSTSAYRQHCKLLPEWETWLKELDFSEVLPERVDIPKYTLSQRKTDTLRWFYRTCIREVKGFVAAFGLDGLQKALRFDAREVPDKYRVLIDLSGDYEATKYNLNFGHDYPVQYENYVNLSDTDVPEWTKF